ncbi:hypothetical protein vseg_019323 [Gypsophila vaccaria]
MSFFQFVQRTVNALLKYFGFGSASTPTRTPKSSDELMSSHAEEFIVTREIRSRGVKRPPKPPVHTGRGGQIHSSFL